MQKAPGTLKLGIRTDAMLLYSLERGPDRPSGSRWPGTESGEVFRDCRYSLAQILTVPSRHFATIQLPLRPQLLAETNGSYCILGTGLALNRSIDFISIAQLNMRY